MSWIFSRPGTAVSWPLAATRMRSGSAVTIFSRSGLSCHRLSTPLSRASSAHWLKNPSSLSAVEPVVAPPVATTGASTASREPVSPTAVETMRCGCSGISTSSVAQVEMSIWSVQSRWWFSTASEETVRGQEPSPEPPPVASSSELSPEQAARPAVRASAAATAVALRRASDLRRRKGASMRSVLLGVGRQGNSHGSRGMQSYYLASQC